MLDHGQLGPPTPASTGTFTTVESTRAKLPGPDGTPGLGPGTSESLSMSASVEERKPDPPSVSAFVHPNSISAQLYANPNLAPLRTAGFPASATQPPTLTSAPPILVDPRCSGYFVETVCPYDSPSYYPLTSRHQMKWMQPFLGGGETAGKIVCPNKKCGAKLGNYDWAGVRCSCKAWVVPVRTVLRC